MAGSFQQEQGPFETGTRSRPTISDETFLLMLLFVALACRLAWVAWTMSGPEFDKYPWLAAALVRESWVGREVFASSPLYVYITAVLQQAVGLSAFGVRLIQAFAGAATACVLLLAGRLLLGRPAARLGAALYALYPAAILLEKRAIT